MRSNSAGGITAPVGLFGELMMTIRVRGVMAASTCSARSAETVGGLGGHEHGLAAGELDDVREADPVRRGNDDFVALFDQRADGVVDGVLAADGDDAFARARRSCRVARVPVADGLAQRRDARGRRVLGAIRARSASMAACLMCSGVGKSGSPGPKSTTSTPWL